jgi:tRNA-dihydrouridine synthase
MPCQSNNATPPTPAIAPGAESIDAAAVASRCTIDPRIPAAVPGFDAPFFQAGLAGYSDAAMRIVARRHGCPYCVTEALLDRTLLGGGKGFAKANLENLADNVPGGDEDHPLAGQIMGSDPNEMAAAAVKLVEQAKRPAHEYRKIRERGIDAAPEGKAVEPCPTQQTFSTIDINLACPVKKIKAKARGGHWLREPEGAIEILRAVREALPTEIITSVKLRRGSDDSPEAAHNFERIFSAAYDMGYTWATVHARTVEQKYVGPSRWQFLKDLTARHPDKLIFASGDIWRAEDIFRIIDFAGVHAVAVARGCIGNPWIFRQARQLMAGRPAIPPTIAEQRAVLEDHFRLSVAVNGEVLAGRLMRKFGIRFSAHHPEAEPVRLGFIKVSTTEEWLAVLNEHYTA